MINPVEGFKNRNEELKTQWNKAQERMNQLNEIYKNLTNLQDKYNVFQELRKLFIERENINANFKQLVSDMQNYVDNLSNKT